MVVLLIVNFFMNETVFILDFWSSWDQGMHLSALSSWCLLAYGNFSIKTHWKCSKYLQDLKRGCNESSILLSYLVSKNLNTKPTGESTMVMGFSPSPSLITTNFWKCKKQISKSLTHTHTHKIGGLWRRVKIFFFLFLRSCFVSRYQSGSHTLSEEKCWQKSCHPLGQRNQKREPL